MAELELFLTLNQAVNLNCYSYGHDVKQFIGNLPITLYKNRELTILTGLSRTTINSYRKAAITEKQTFDHFDIITIYY